MISKYDSYNFYDFRFDYSSLRTGGILIIWRLYLNKAFNHIKPLVLKWMRGFFIVKIKWMYRIAAIAGGCNPPGLNGLPWFESKCIHQNKMKILLDIERTKEFMMLVFQSSSVGRAMDWKSMRHWFKSDLWNQIFKEGSKMYEYVYCHLCGNLFCQSCGCCQTPGCGACSCPDALDEDDE